MECIKCKQPLPEGARFCPFCGKEQTPKKNRRTRPNGTGSVYKRGKTWEAAVVLGYKLIDQKAVPVRRTKSGFKTKKEAMEYLPTLKNEKRRITPTLGELWEQYKATKYKKLSDSRKEKYEIAWKKIEFLAFTKIDTLVFMDLQEAVDTSAATYYPARDIKDLFSKLFQLAMIDQFVTTNLAEHIELPDLKAKKQEAFPEGDITKLWEDYSAGNWWTGYILLMIYTGMMPGELFDARKSHINWEGKRIDGAGKKTKERRESPIVLADIIVPVLADLCANTPGEKLIRINKDNFYEKYYATLERAGCQRLRPYACRHTAATSLAMENIPPSVIQKIMRHSKFSTTEKYIHVDIGPMLAAVNQLKDPKKE